MRPSFDVPSDGRVGDHPSLFDVPISLWAYAMLRALAFLAPALAADGRIGFGVVVVPVLFVFVIRRSRMAYQVLVLLDIFSAVMLLTAWLGADDNPVSVPILTGLSLVALLWPSNWRYVTAETQPTTFTNHSDRRGY